MKNIIKKEFLIAIKKTIDKMNEVEFMEFMKRIMKVIEEIENERNRN